MDLGSGFNWDISKPKYFYLLFIVNDIMLVTVLLVDVIRERFDHCG